jgi:hypothetical protein
VTILPSGFGGEKRHKRFLQNTGLPFLWQTTYKFSTGPVFYFKEEKDLPNTGNSF